MRIVVNDIAASEGGAMTVLKDFYTDIVKNHVDIEWIFLLGDNYLQETKNIKVYTFSEIKQNWFKRIKFELYSGARIINRLDADIYISLQNTATLGVKSKQYVYFHQVIPYQTTVKFSLFRKEESILWVYQNIGRKIYDFLFKHSEANIIVQSRWLKQRMNNFLANNILINKPSISANITTKNERSDRTNPVQFFFPTSNNPYKNINVIFNAVEILKKQNITNFKVILTIDDINHQNNNYINCIGKINRQSVYEYLANSVLIFPSLLESFGLPLLEAADIGTYILAADLEYAHETLENYKNAKYFPPQDAEKLADLMKDIIKNGTDNMPSNTIDSYGRKTADLILEDYNE